MQLIPEEYFPVFTVYILYSPVFDKIYIGFTSDLNQRLLSHNHLSNKGWTKKYRPWEVIHQENFDSKQEAMRREKNLKSGQGRAWIHSTLLKK